MSSSTTQKFQDLKFHFDNLNPSTVFKTSTGEQKLPFEGEYHQMIQSLDFFIGRNFTDVAEYEIEIIYALYLDLWNFLSALSIVPDEEYYTRRKDFISESELLVGRYHSQIQPIKTRVLIKSSFQETEQELTTLKEKISKNNEGLLTNDRLRKKLDEDIKRVEKEYGAKLQLLHESKIFEEAAKNNKQTAFYWFIGIIAAVCLFIIIIIKMKNNFCFDLKCYDVSDLGAYKSVCEDCAEHVLVYELIKSMLFRLLIISMLIYLISFCVKNFNAALHNRTINKHRDNSFKAAFHFYNNMGSDNKDEMLMKAADALFTYQKTGYYGKDSEPQTPSFIGGVIEKITSK
ncbi:MAG: hypothetical protein V4581_16705 [Bacteroidota bacterium]